MPTHELTECPRCESEQQFTRRLRQVEGGAWWEAFIRCSICRYTVVLGETTPAIEECRKRLAALDERAKREEHRHGSVQGNTAAIVQRIYLRYSEMEVELRRRIRSVNGEDTDAASA